MCLSSGILRVSNETIAQDILQANKTEWLIE